MENRESRAVRFNNIGGYRITRTRFKALLAFTISTSHSSAAYNARLNAKGVFDH